MFSGFRENVHWEKMVIMPTTFRFSLKRPYLFQYWNSNIEMAKTSLFLNTGMLMQPFSGES